MRKQGKSRLKNGGKNVGNSMTDREKELLLTLLEKWRSEEVKKPIQVMNTDVIDRIVALGQKLKGELK